MLVLMWQKSFYFSSLWKAIKQFLINLKYVSSIATRLVPRVFSGGTTSPRGYRYPLPPAPPPVHCTMCLLIFEVEGAESWRVLRYVWFNSRTWMSDLSSALPHFSDGIVMTVLQIVCICLKGSHVVFLLNHWFIYAVCTATGVKKFSLPEPMGI